MAQTYIVTGQHQARGLNADGTGYPAIQITYETKADPPVKGSVMVPASLLEDHAAFLAQVKQKIEEAVAGHTAVANL